MGNAEPAHEERALAVEKPRWRPWQFATRGDPPRSPARGHASRAVVVGKNGTVGHT